MGRSLLERREPTLPLPPDALRTRTAGPQPEARPADSPVPLSSGGGWMAAADRWLLRRMLQGLGNPPLAFDLWNGHTVAGLASAQPAVRLRIGDRATLWRLALNPEIEFGEGYTRGRIQVKGDLIELLRCVYRSLGERGRSNSLGARLASWWQLPGWYSIARSRQNARHHYDLGNDFYRLWLDPQLSYTCAYFANPRQSLAQAQVEKMRHVCRKLRLRPGEKVIEAGCGWGALALYMARHWGVSVTACNISHEQVMYAREWARREGLANQVEFVEDDWRNLRGSAAAFVSVGMLEHVGPANYGLLGTVMRRCLCQGGRGLIHTIGQLSAQPLNGWIRRRIFPGAYPPTLAQALALFDAHEFAVLDVENLRPHYAETLLHWRRQFEQAAATVQQQYGEPFVRMWRLYLCGSQVAFETGQLQLFQILFAERANDRLPWTRADMYTPGALPAASEPAPPSLAGSEWHGDF